VSQISTIIFEKVAYKGKIFIQEENVRKNTSMIAFATKCLIRFNIADENGTKISSEKG
jgi:hypothetical protein